VLSLSIAGWVSSLNPTCLLSEAELNLIQFRMRQGRESKAKRGDLYSLVPPGYIVNNQEIIEKSPDKREQEVFDLIFKKFRQSGSGNQTYLWFVDEKIEVPVNCKGRDVEDRKRRWQLPSHGFILSILHNPFDAGAYAYGRRCSRVFYENGQIKKDQWPLEKARGLGYTDKKPP
jgi:hypothetical protein